MLPCPNAFLARLSAASVPADDDALPAPPLHSLFLSRNSSTLLALSDSHVFLLASRPLVVLSRLARNLADIHSLVWHTNSSFCVLTSSAHLLYYRIRSHPANLAPYRVNPAPGLDLSPFSPGPAESNDFNPLFIDPLADLDFSSSPPTAITALPESLLVASGIDRPTLRLIPWAAFSTPHSPLSFPPIFLDSLPWYSPVSPAIDVLEYYPSFDILVILSQDGSCYVVPNLKTNTSFTSGKCIYSSKSFASRPYPAVTFAFNYEFSLLTLGLSDGSCLVYSLSNFQNSQAVHLSHTLSLKDNHLDDDHNTHTGSVTCLSWTADGLALAVGWENGWSVWSVYGRLCTCTVSDPSTCDSLSQDRFAHGVVSLVWGPGDSQLYVLARGDLPLNDGVKNAFDQQLYTLSFAKSSYFPSLNPRHPILLQDDKVLLYRGSDQADPSVLNPQSDVWQYIQIAPEYISVNWPIKYTCVSSDGSLVAVAGDHGLAYVDTITSKWYTFESVDEENSFSVQGGMHWHDGNLIVATHQDGMYWLRVFLNLKENNSPLSLNLKNAPICATYKTPVVICSLINNSLLVYTQNSTLYHYLLPQSSSSFSSQPSFSSSTTTNRFSLDPASRQLRWSSKFKQDHQNGAPFQLIPCGSIGFEGVVQDTLHVRGLSWLIPVSHIKYGDISEDLDVATVIFLIQGKLILLRPRKAAKEEVKYDLQVLTDRIEFFWAHFTCGEETLSNSLWGWDGKKFRIWLDALTIDSAASLLLGNTPTVVRRQSMLTGHHGRQRSASMGDVVVCKSPAGPNNEASLDSTTSITSITSTTNDDYLDTPSRIAEPVAVKESLNISLDFHPLAIFMDKGIIVGVEAETILRRRSFDFVSFRIVNHTRLFLHKILHVYLSQRDKEKALSLSKHYQSLSYFQHALEMLLHDVLETEADNEDVTPSSSPKRSTAKEKDAKEETSSSSSPSRKQRPSAIKITTSDTRPRLLPTINTFLQHFQNHYLQVIVGCARKTELARWNYLFSVVGSPQTLFEKCLQDDNIELAASYLIVLHTMEPIEQSSKMTFRLLKACIAEQNWQLGKELLRFLSSLDDTGALLRKALFEANALPPGFLPPTLNSPSSVVTTNTAHSPMS